jgi:hypothetical protein
MKINKGTVYIQNTAANNKNMVIEEHEKPRL